MPHSDQFAAAHRACDTAFARIEPAANDADWSQARRAAEQFVALIEAHFRREEGQLFPALEALTPMAVGPTNVMRAEYAQLRELLAELTAGVGQHDRDRLLNAVDILWLQQQHNAKDEADLYPLADRLLAVQTPQPRWG